MKRYALIIGTLVVNVAIANDANAFTGTGFLVEEIPMGLAVGIGWTFAGGVFAAPVPTLIEAQELKLLEIAAKSSDLLREGFEFSGLVFALDEAAQSELARLDQYKLALAYPFSYPTRDGLEATKLASAADVDAFTQPAFERVQQVLIEGADLGDQVRAATTVAQVEAIQDTRT